MLILNSMVKKCCDVFKVIRTHFRDGSLSLNEMVLGDCSIQMEAVTGPSPKDFIPIKASSLIRLGPNGLLWEAWSELGLQSGILRQIDVCMCVCVSVWDWSIETKSQSLGLINTIWNYEIQSTSLVYCAFLSYMHLSMKSRPLEPRDNNKQLCLCKDLLFPSNQDTLSVEFKEFKTWQHFNVSLPQLERYNNIACTFIIIYWKILLNMTFTLNALSVSL